jgi:hypothetical protein
MNPPANFRTKMCRNTYVGCFNIDCNFAHNSQECRSALSYAHTNVKFVYPTHYDFLQTSFIVKVRDDDDDDDDDIIQPSMSLSGLIQLNESQEIQDDKKKWLDAKQETASKHRMWHMVRELIRMRSYFEPNGELDMDCSN